MQIVEFNDSYSGRYEDFLNSSNTSLLYYSLKYKMFLEELLNCKSRYLLALEKDKIIGVLPLMEKNGAFGKVINSLPFYGSNGGALSNDLSVRTALYKSLDNIVADESISAATVVTHPLLQPKDNPIKYDFIDERIGQWTPLKTTEVESMTIFDSSTRRNIRKAMKSDIKIKIDNNAWQFLEETHLDNMKAIGGNAKGHDFFVMAQKHFNAGEDYNIYIAELDNKPVAAILLFYYNKTVEYFTPVTIDSAKNLQPTALIIRTAMVDAAKKGFTWWNWGGTWKSQDGVYRFKKKWGAQDFPYKYFTKLNNQDILEQSADTLLKEYPDFFVVPFDVLKKPR
jgi:hypothetical protein